mmetsp:Transcript_22905/g.51542  ORF Transcript_22905/g.51542 Transcript_22905/m.51542 type:complete len:360 (+) Transcript_22905:2-1081(+)
MLPRRHQSRPRRTQKRLWKTQRRWLKKQQTLRVMLPRQHQSRPRRRRLSRAMALRLRLPLKRIVPKPSCRQAIPRLPKHCKRHGKRTRRQRKARPQSRPRLMRRHQRSPRAWAGCMPPPWRPPGCYGAPQCAVRGALQTVSAAGVLLPKHCRLLRLHLKARRPRRRSSSGPGSARSARRSAHSRRRWSSILPRMRTLRRQKKRRQKKMLCRTSLLMPRRKMTRHLRLPMHRLPLRCITRPTLHQERQANLPAPKLHHRRLRHPCQFRSQRFRRRCRRSPEAKPRSPRRSSRRRNLCASPRRRRPRRPRRLILSRRNLKERRPRSCRKLRGSGQLFQSRRRAKRPKNPLQSTCTCRHSTV